MKTNLINKSLILNYIEEKKITISKFCDICGISKTTYYKIINGKNFVLLAIFKIARVIKVPVHNFFKNN